jgi:hypothetical protein
VGDVAFAESAGGDEPLSLPKSAPESGQRSLAPLLAVCAGYFMVILDVTIINVAVPVVGRELSASLTGIQWITDGYTMVFAGLPRACSTPPARSAAPPAWHSGAACSPRAPTTARGCASAWASARSPT